MATTPAGSPAPTAEEVLEDLVLQQEESLEEGARFPVLLNFGTNEEPDIREIGPDQSDEVKARIASEAVSRRAESYADETYRYAKFKLSKLNDVEAVDAIRELSPGDRDIWLRAEFDGQARDDIFAVFGLPPDVDEEN